jgi:hypothetical protein
LPALRMKVDARFNQLHSKSDFRIGSLHVLWR